MSLVHIVVQARAGSTRLPAKILENIGDTPALLWCLRRCQKIEGARVVVALSDTPSSDEIEELAISDGFDVVRGSDQDVLARTAKAARDTGADLVMRVTSDCPLIDPATCQAVIGMLYKHKADYACNNMPPSWPHGMDCEVFPASLLHEADRRATEAFDREHVTPWIRRQQDLERISMTGPGGILARLRWTLDYQEDLKFFQCLDAAMCGRAIDATAAELASLCLRRPDITGINAHKIDEARLGDNLTPSFATQPMAFAA